MFMHNRPVNSSLPVAAKAMTSPDKWQELVKCQDMRYLGHADLVFSEAEWSVLNGQNATGLAQIATILKTDMGVCEKDCVSTKMADGGQPVLPTPVPTFQDCPLKDLDIYPKSS